MKRCGVVLASFALTGTLWVGRAAEWQKPEKVTGPFRPWQLVHGVSQQLSGVAFGNGRFVAVSESSGLVFVSTNGFVWAHHQFPEPYSLDDVVFADDRFLAIGYLDLNRFERIRLSFTSTNGLDWAVRQSFGRDAECESLAFGNGRFVAAGPSGVYASSDGIRWARARKEEVYFVTFGNGKFVGASLSGLQTSTSANGIVWTPAKQVGEELVTGLFFGNGRFWCPVVSGLWTSEDGENWSWRGIPIEVELFASGAGHGQIVAVGSAPRGTPADLAFLPRPGFHLSSPPLMEKIGSQPRLHPATFSERSFSATASFWPVVGSGLTRSRPMVFTGPKSKELDPSIS